MGWLKKFGKKLLGHTVDAVRQGAPVADFFYPGSGQILSKGANFVGKKTGTQDEGFFKEWDTAADFVDNNVTPIMSLYTSGGTSMLSGGNGLPTPQILDANRGNEIGSGIQSGSGFDFNSIGSIAQGLGQLQDLFSGGASGRVSDYYDSLNQANKLIVDFAGQQAEKDYALAQQEHAARAAYSAAAGAAKARAAAARAAAARQEEENRLKAARKSLKVQKTARKRASDMYAPYVDTGHRALATSEGLFNAGAGMLGGLQSMLGTAPSGISILNKVSK